MKPADICIAVLVAVIWGLGFIGSRLALNDLSPELMTALRFSIAALPCLFLRKPAVSWPILIAVSGIVVGALARLALPGKDPMTLGQTMLIGIAGSLIGGLITWAIWDAGPGIAIAVLFATVIVYFVRRSRGGGFTSPGRPPVDR